MKVIKSGNIQIPSKHNRPILIDYRYPITEERLPMVLFVHGFKGFKDWGYFNLMADYYAKNGFMFAKMNFSHNGTTPDQPTDFADLEAFGNNNFTKELDDIETVLDYLCSDKFELRKHIDYNRLCIKGHSRGGGVSLLKAHEDKRIKKMVTFAGMSDLRYSQTEKVLSHWKKEGVVLIPNLRTKQNMPMYYQIVENLLADVKRFDIEDAVKNLTQPLLIIHGTNDETLPLSMAETIKEWKPDAHLKIIENADHTFGGSHPYNSDVLPKHALIAINSVIQFLK